MVQPQSKWIDTTSKLIIKPKCQAFEVTLPFQQTWPNGVLLIAYNYLLESQCENLTIKALNEKPLGCVYMLFYGRSSSMYFLQKQLPDSYFVAPVELQMFAKP